MSPDEMKSLIMLFFEEVWNRGNLKALEVFLEPDFVYHNPSFPNRCNGIRGYRQIVTTLRQAFPDQKWKLEDVLADGDKVVTRWTMQGTHCHFYLGIPPTGKRVTFSGISINRFVGGQIAEQWVYSDALGFLLQEGYVPAHEEAQPLRY